MLMVGYKAGALILVGNIQASFKNVTFANNGYGSGSKVYGGAIHINSAYEGAPLATYTSGEYVSIAVFFLHLPTNHVIFTKAHAF